MTESLDAVENGAPGHGHIDLFGSIDLARVVGGVHAEGRIGSRSSIFADGWIARDFGRREWDGGLLGGFRYRW